MIMSQEKNEQPVFVPLPPVVIDLIGLVFYEIPSGTAPLGLTPSASLGGMLAGWLFFHFLYSSPKKWLPSLSQS